MKLLKTITLLLVLELFLQLNISAQNKCAEKVIYKTYTIGNGIGSSFLPLQFNIVNDTLTISPEGSKIVMLAFTIQEKSCAWNTENTDGESTYKLLPITTGAGKATLTISSKNNKGKIVLQYDEIKEPRVFDMQKNTENN